jgi:YidC/Oxa1 family membrane protein insertase
MEKRAIIAITLSVLVLLAFRYFDEWRRGPSEAKLPAVQTRSRTPEPLTQAVPPSPVKAESEAAEPSIGDTDEKGRTVVIEGETYRAVLDNRGAVLTSWQLKKYKSAQGRVFEVIAAGQDKETGSFPGSMIFEDPKLTSLANNEFYQISVDGAPTGGAALTPPVTVALKLKRGDILIEKRYSFEKDRYLVELSGFQRGRQGPGRPLPSGSGYRTGTGAPGQLDKACGCLLFRRQGETRKRPKG